MKKKSKRLEKERKMTNESLITEREKTNVAFSKSKGITERKTDKVIQDERLEADKATSSYRQEVDSDHKIKKKEQGKTERDGKKDHDDLRLKDERRRSDEAVERERSRLDIVIEDEREVTKQAETHLLTQERQLTDKNLSVERSHTDIEVLQASNLLENEVTEHSKTKVALTTRNELLAIVSHDLKNPISFVSTCAQMLLEQPAYKNMQPELKEWIENIKENADLSLRLIRDLLDMERLAKEKLVLKLEKHKLEKMIKNSITRFSHIACAKNIILQAVPSDISGIIVCDYDRIMQVLSNLIDNALKFTPARGIISVGVTLSSTEVQVFVQDTGPGIAKEKQEHIFERFSQIGTKNRVGLGLGLYISKMLIEAHHGQLWVQTKVGAGSTFYFSIPTTLD